MSLEVTGKLLLKYDAMQVSEKFKKREFVVELAEEINGNIYTNFAKMQLVQNKCEIIDRFNVGDVVKVSFNIKGTAYVDKKDGVTKYITNLDAWRVESATAAATNSSQPAPAYSGNSNTNFNTASSSAPATEPVDDLPF